MTTSAARSIFPRAIAIEGSLEAVRERTAERLERLVAFVLAPAVVLVILTEIVAGRIGVGLVLYGVVQLAALIAIAIAGGASFRVRSGLLLGYAFSMLAASTACFGPTLGQGVIAVAAAVWAGISYGRRGALLASLFAFALILGIGLAQLGGLLPAPAASDFSSTSASVGRAVMTAAGSLAIGWVFARLLVDYQRVVDGASRALDDAQVEHTRVEETSQRLQQLQRMDAMQRLAKGAGYNINSALSVVLCNAEILSRSQDPLEAELASEILDAARNVGKTSRGLFTLGQARATRNEAARPSELVDRLERSFARMLPPSIRFVSQVTTTRRARIGAESLERILLNLCVNARDAMPEGGVLTVRVFDGETASGSCVWIEVVDTGTGMSPELQARVFEPFFTTKSASRGSGLGLPTVRTLIDIAGGRLSVYSRVGEGTRFAIELPAVSVDGEEPIDSGVVDTARLSVLYLDDDESVRRSVERLLRSEGHHVVTTGDVPAALAYLEGEQRFDVLIIDGVLPEGEPREVVERFRETSPRGKVVVCSGHSREELARRGLDTVADVRLEKPFSRAELHAALGPESPP